MSHFTLIASAGLLSATSSSSAQTVQNQNSYTAFVSAVAALAASADDLITNERNTARWIYIRQKVTEKILAVFPANDAAAPNTLKLDDVLDLKTLLCSFRWTKQWTIAKPISVRDSNASITIDQLAATAEQNYLRSVRQLNAAATPANTGNLISALKVLFAPPPPTVPEFATEAVSRRQDPK